MNNSSKAPDEHNPNILMEYRNQQEDVLYGRINVFLIAQSMLFVAYTTSATQAQSGLITGAIAYMGTVLTILWLFGLMRQVFVFKFAQDYVVKRIPTYEGLRNKRKEEEDKKWFHSHFAGQELLCYSLPLLTLIMWFVLTINAIEKDLINKIAKENATFVSLWIVGAFLGFLFLKRTSLRLMQDKKQRLLARLPLMVFLSWSTWGVAVLFLGFMRKPWIDKHAHIMNYIAFGLVILFVVLLPAFRGKPLKIRMPI